jgi:lipoprotein-releasing system permease protein
MQLGYFIARKLGLRKQQSFTRTITKLAVVAIAVSISIVILSYGILLGFKSEIKNKVTGYAGDLTVKNYQLSQGSENSIISIDYELLNNIKAVDNVTSVTPFINKAGILKSDSVIEGLIFRGLPANYDFNFFEKHLIRGEMPEYSDTVDSYDIIISEHTAKLLECDTGSRVFLFFIEDGNVRRRRPRITGIFNTGLLEFDKQFSICHLRMLQRIIRPDYTAASGYEIKLNDFDKLETSEEEIGNELSYEMSARTVKLQYPTLFQWLEIVDTNVYVIIVLMLVVAAINIVTILLILIIDRIPMIGILKSLGATTKKVLSVFNWYGVFILVGGLIIGNVLALGLAFLQVKFKLVKLDADTYYMDAVPFDLPFSYWFAINICALIICFVFTYLPVSIISKVSPAQAIKFD